MRAFRLFVVLWLLLVGGLLVGPVRGQANETQPFGGFGGDFLGQGEAEPVITVTSQFTAPTAEQPSRLFVTATIKPNWHIYSITQAPGGPLPTRIQLDTSTTYRLLGDFRAEPPPDEKAEPLFDNLVVQSHHGRVVWYVPIAIASGVDPASLQITGSVVAQACDPHTCLPPQEFPFAAALGSGVPVGGPPSAGPVSTNALSAMLGAALLGGLILNLMPCVLPVISLKLLAFVEQSGQSRARVFALNLWYAAGLILVFLVLATLSTAFSMAWGEQFTLTWFKVAITALVFVMALSFLGVWEIPIPGFVGSGKAGQLQAREGAVGSFSKGVFTTILATPCTGPFLGTVFGFTLKQPAYVTYLIFAAAGLGMALPYLVISLVPELIRLLPKPGAWMETLKEVMGFLLLATVVYLFTTMSPQYFVPSLALLVGLWFACWLIGRTPLTASPSRRRSAWLGGTVTAMAVGLFGFTVLLEQPKLPWKDFSAETLEQARAEGKTVMVDFTADWCPNCKWNLKFAIDTEAVGQLVAKNGVVPMVADWTDRSPAIKEFLVKRLNRQAIPVLAIWPAGATDDQVIILDGTLIKSQVLDALQRAGPSRSHEGGPRTAMTLGPM